MAMRAPARRPLLVEAPAVLRKQRAVGAGAGEPADRCLTEVMDEHVLGARDLIATQPDPAHVVVVLEHAQPEALVERPDLLIDLAPQGCAEQGQRGDLRARARALAQPRRSEASKAFVCDVVGLYLRLCRRAVADRAHETE